jgi:hypothetical protein
MSRSSVPCRRAIRACSSFRVGIRHEYLPRPKGCQFRIDGVGRFITRTIFRAVRLRHGWRTPFAHPFACGPLGTGTRRFLVRSAYRTATPRQRTQLDFSAQGSTSKSNLSLDSMARRISWSSVAPRWAADRDSNHTAKRSWVRSNLKRSRNERRPLARTRGKRRSGTSHRSLAGLKSRWMTPCSWAASRASAICFANRDSWRLRAGSGAGLGRVKVQSGQVDCRWGRPQYSAAQCLVGPPVVAGLKQLVFYTLRR